MSDPYHLSIQNIMKLKMDQEVVERIDNPNIIINDGK